MLVESFHYSALNLELLYRFLNFVYKLGLDYKLGLILYPGYSTIWHSTFRLWNVNWETDIIHNTWLLSFYFFFVQFAEIMMKIEVYISKQPKASEGTASFLFWFGLEMHHIHVATWPFFWAPKACWATVWAVWNPLQSLCAVLRRANVYVACTVVILSIWISTLPFPVPSVRPGRGGTWIQSHCGCQQPHRGNWEWAEWVGMSMLALGMGVWS